jgi:uncharacterized protein
MGTLGWILLVAVGIALGFSIGRLWPGSPARIAALERERDAAREDLGNYRQEVKSHFERTAQLFDKVTADYRSLYEPLAVGARQLGAIPGESAEARLAEPEQRRLALDDGLDITAAGAAASAAAADRPSTSPEPGSGEDLELRPPRDYDDSAEPEEEARPEPEAETPPEEPESPERPVADSGR